MINVKQENPAKLADRDQLFTHLTTSKPFAR